MFLRSTALFLVLMASGGSLALADTAPPTYEMSADGEVQIAPDGHVSDYRLQSKLMPTVANLVDRNVHNWLFEPILVDGVPVGNVDVQSYRELFTRVVYTEHWLRRDGYAPRQHWRA